MKIFLLQLGVIFLLANQTQAQLVAVAGNDTTICPNTTVTLGGNPTSAGGTAPYIYTWAPAAGLNDPASSNPMASPLTVTTYKVTVTDNLGLTATSSVTINLHTLPVFTQLSASDTLFCQLPGTVNFTAALNTQAPPYAYLWSFDNGLTSAQNNPTVVFSTPGIYNVVLSVTDSNQCVITGSMHIQASQLAVTTTPTNIPCFGATGSIHPTATGGNGNYTYNWGGGITTQNIFVNVPGTYTVTVSEWPTGCSTTASAIVTQAPAFTAIVQPTNESVNGACDGSATIIATGGTAAYTYLWSNNATSATQFNLCAGTYSVTVMDGNACSATALGVVATACANNTLVASITSHDLSCTHLTDTMTLNITGGTLPYNYFWNTGEVGQSIITDQPGIYTGWVTDAGGCQRMLSDTLLNTGLVVTLERDTPVHCSGGPNGFIKVHVAGATPPYTYLWNNGGTADSLMHLASATYTLTVTDVTLCSVSFTHYLDQTSNDWGYYVQLTATNANCSNNGSVSANVYGGTPPITYQWSYNSDTAQTLTGLAPGYYNVTVTGGDGCTRTGQSAITANCFNIITGQVYNDANINCVKDNGETPGGAGYYVSATGSGGTFYGYVANGAYTIHVGGVGVYTVAFAPNYWSGSCGIASGCAPQTVTFTNLGDSAVANFGIETSVAYNLSLHPGWSSANPGFTKTYWVLYSQYSALLYTGAAVITFTYDSALQYQSCNNGGIQNPLNHTITWNVDSVPLSWDWSTRPMADFIVPLNLAPGYLLKQDFLISPLANDCDTTDNHLIYIEPVTGSHDPNAKEVWPARELNPEDTALTYTIHFQNTGTDTTWFITIKDTLSQYLEPASVVNLASSHAYSAFDISEGGILTWKFNPIFLVDSNTNEPASKGFIMFKVKKKSGLPSGTEIRNRASIYFDYNEPVLTNQVSNTISQPLSVNEITATAIKLYPNPTTGMLNIEFENTQSGKAVIEIENLLGQTVLSKTTEATAGKNLVQLPVNELAGGMYLLKLQAGAKKFEVRKFLVEK